MKGGWRIFLELSIRICSLVKFELVPVANLQSFSYALRIVFSFLTWLASSLEDNWTFKSMIWPDGRKYFKMNFLSEAVLCLCSRSHKNSPSAQPKPVEVHDLKANTSWMKPGCSLCVAEVNKTVPKKTDRATKSSWLLVLAPAPACCTHVYPSWCECCLDVSNSIRAVAPVHGLHSMQQQLCPSCQDNALRP